MDNSEVRRQQPAFDGTLSPHYSCRTLTLFQQRRQSELSGLTGPRRVQPLLAVPVSSGALIAETWPSRMALE
jgi:hypothetical protein